jgi:hypothetical protein
MEMNLAGLVSVWNLSMKYGFTLVPNRLKFNSLYAVQFFEKASDFCSILDPFPQSGSVIACHIVVFSFIFCLMLFVVWCAKFYFCL